MRVVTTHDTEICYRKLLVECEYMYWRNDDDREESYAGKQYDPTASEAIDLASWADVLLIAPATMDVIADIASRRATSLLAEVANIWQCDQAKLEKARAKLPENLREHAPTRAKPLIVAPTLNVWQWAGSVQAAPPRPANQEHPRTPRDRLAAHAAWPKVTAGARITAEIVLDCGFANETAVEQARVLQAIRSLMSRGLTVFELTLHGFRSTEETREALDDYGCETIVVREEM